MADEILAPTPLLGGKIAVAAISSKYSFNTMNAALEIQPYVPGVHPHPNVSNPVLRPPTLEQMARVESERMANAPPPPINIHPSHYRPLAFQDVALAAQRRDTAIGARQRFDEAMARYEAQRQELDDTLRQAWTAAQDYHNTTASPLPHLEMDKLLSINLPTFKVNNFIDAGFTTTQAHVQQYQSSMGRTW